MRKINYSELPLKEGEVLAENNHRYVETENDLVEMKYCPRCKQWHPLSDYLINTSTKDGLQSWCKACQKEYNRQRTALKKSNAQVNEMPIEPIEQEQVIENDHFDDVIELLSSMRIRYEEQCQEIIRLKKEIKSLSTKSPDLESLSERELELVLKSNKIAPRLLFEAIARQDDRYSFYAIDRVTGLTSTIKIEREVA